MTFIAAVATGLESVAELERSLRGPRERREVSLVSHEGQAVAWSAVHPWVSSYDDGDVCVVLDGQLHNLFHESRPSAALLVERYRELGSDLGRGLLGDFVVIVLDRTRHSLLVVRDPLGVRPWYQATKGGRHAGASDLATLCELSWVDRSMNDREALAFLAGLSQSRGQTLYRGIHTLGPGSTWHLSDGTARTWPHLEWDIRPELDVSWEEAVQRCRDVLDEVVLSRIRAGGAATCELSGGLDSSAVTGTAVLLGALDVIAGRLLFNEPDADEREYSDAVIGHWGLRPVSTPPWIPTEDEVHQWTISLRRPVPDPNFAMLATLQRALVSEGRPAVMSGVGGDDAFIERSRPSRVASALRHRQFEVLKSVLRDDVRHPRGAWHTWRGVMAYRLPRRRRQSVPYPISPSAAKACELTDLLNYDAPHLTGDRAVDERARGLTSGYITYVLEQEALLADTTGCRSTHPFLDPRFVTATYGLNPWFPVRGGHDRALEVAAYEDRLPELVRTRRSKAEFSSVSNKATLMDARAQQQLLTGPLHDRGWIEKTRLTELLEDADRKLPGAAQRTARLRSLDRWLRSIS